MLISADWMGAAARHLSGSAGSHGVPIFLQGCAGQINPDATAATFEEADRLGSEMAEAVLGALTRGQPFGGLPLAARLERIALPLQDAESPEEARLQLNSAQAQLDRVAAQGEHPYVLRAFGQLVSHAQMMLARAESGAKGETLPFAVQAIRVGDLAIVGLSGEVFFEFAHTIQAGSPFRHTLVLGYSNGCTCYIPAKEAFEEGGYEADDSFRWYGVPPLRPDAGDLMATAAIRLLQRLEGT